MVWTLPVKPCGGSHLAIASGSRNARYTRSAGARSTRWSRMVFVEFDMSSLSFEVRDHPGEGDLGLVHSSNELPSNRHPAVIFHCLAAPQGLPGVTSNTPRTTRSL